MKSDLDRLKQRLDELEKVDSRCRALEAQVQDARKGEEHWKAAFNEAQDQLKAKVHDAEVISSERRDAEERLRQAQVALVGMQKKVSRYEEMFKVEERGRVGREKRMKILEHEATTCREEVVRVKAQQLAMELKIQELEKNWLHERGLRLQDLHKTEAHSSTAKRQQMHAKEAEERWMESEKNYAKLEEELRISKDQLKARLLVERAHDGQAKAQDSEMGLLKKEILKLKNEIIERDSKLDVLTATLAKSNRRRQTPASEAGRVTKPSGEIAKRGPFLLPPERKRSPFHPSSTLSLPGSLYISRGLDFKKDTTAVFSGGSPTETLKSILNH